MSGTADDNSDQLVGKKILREVPQLDQKAGRDLLASGEARPAVKEITSWFSDRHGDDYERKITTKWIGGVIRRKLRLTTERTRDGYVIRDDERPKIHRLYERYGLPESVDDAASSTTGQGDAITVNL